MHIGIRALCFFFSLLLTSPVASGLTMSAPVAAEADALSVMALPGDGASSPNLSGGSGAFVLETNAEAKLPTAGLARLPALLFACRALDEGRLTADTDVTVSSQAAGIPGPTAFITANESISAESLMKAAVMITAGDAIYALAEAASGSASQAAEEITALLTSLGIDASGYTLERGLETATARELCALMGALALSNAYTGFSSLTYEKITHEGGRETELANPNKLARTLEGSLGGSTGSNGGANYCGVFASKRNGTVFVCAVMGAHDSASRFRAAADAINSAFASYKAECAVKRGDVVVEGAQVSGGVLEKIDLVAAEDAIMLMAKNGEYTTELALPETLQAPLEANMPVGSVRYTFENTTIEVALYPSEAVKRAGLFDMAQIVMKKWAGM